MDPTFFETPADFRAWLAENHAEAGFLWVGFYKKGSGRQSITWPESVDEALCYGWIDGVRKGIDAESYMIRFTRRKPGSVWSSVNVNRVRALSRTRAHAAHRPGWQGGADRGIANPMKWAIPRLTIRRLMLVVAGLAVLSAPPPG